MKVNVQKNPFCSFLAVYLKKDNKFSKNFEKNVNN